MDRLTGESKPVFLTPERLAINLKVKFLEYKKDGFIIAKGKMSIKVLKALTNRYDEFENMQQVFDHLIANGKDLEI